MQLDKHVRTSVKNFEEEFDFMDDCKTMLKTWERRLEDKAGDRKVQPLLNASHIAAYLLDPLHAVCNEAIGFVPHIGAWSIILCYFFQGVSNGDPPGFVWAIICILFFLDLTLALVQFAQFKRVKFVTGFGKAELSYIVLSLTAKQLLAWIEFGSSQSLKPERR
jgi:hypothetical protein